MLRILIVDDNAGFVAVLKGVLGHHRHVTQVDCASNAATGARLAAEGAPHLAFIDVNLAGPSGFDLARQLRRTHPLLPLVMISIADDASYRQHAIAAGASRFVSKGSLFVELPEILSAALAAAPDALAPQGRNSGDDPRPVPADAHDLHTDATGAAIAKYIIVMAHTIGLGVIAEGVESSAQMGYLQSSGCHCIQGGLFKPPVAAAHLESLLQHDNPMQPYAPAVRA